MKRTCNQASEGSGPRCEFFVFKKPQLSLASSSGYLGEIVVSSPLRRENLLRLSNRDGCWPDDAARVAEGRAKAAEIKMGSPTSLTEPITEPLPQLSVNSESSLAVSTDFEYAPVSDSQRLLRIFKWLKKAESPAATEECFFSMRRR